MKVNLFERFSIYLFYIYVGFMIRAFTDSLLDWNFWPFWIGLVIVVIGLSSFTIKCCQSDNA
jgi:hypothetical protein